MRVAIMRRYSSASCRPFSSLPMSLPNPANQGRRNVSDNIASRVTRVIGGSVHALLDAVENATPESTMAQAVREIDQAVDDVRAELGRVEAVKHLATSSLGKLNTQNETLADQIELAVAKGDDGLARAG